MSAEDVKTIANRTNRTCENEHITATKSAMFRWHIIAIVFVLVSPLFAVRVKCRGAGPWARSWHLGR